MNTLIISSSPNKIGLTKSCVDICLNHLNIHGSKTEHINLKERTIVLCKACGERGWGECYEKHFCGLKDDFNSIFKDMGDFDCFIFITPVYFHEMSEVAKAFFDRLKRCDVLNDYSQIKNKPVINIATAGNSGAGREKCLADMHLLTDFLKMEVIDEIGVTRDNFIKMETKIKKTIDKMVNYYNEKN